MDKLKHCLRAMTKREVWPLLLFAAIQAVYHILMREPEGSDAMWFFRNQLDAYTLGEYLSMRYDAWSSRLLIEGVLVYLAGHMALWKLFDWMAWVFLAWALAELFPEEMKKTASCLIVGVLLLYPMWDLKTAGWIATGVNYTWPLSLGVFSLRGTARALYGKETSYPMWALYALAALYGANMEQMAAVLLTVNGCAVVWFAVQKIRFRLSGTAVTGLLIAAAEIVFILTCPGNAARKSQEIINWMPHYDTYCLLDKLSMGFFDTMRHLTSSGNLMFLCYAVLLAVFVFFKTKALWLRLAALFPVALNLLLLGFGGMLETHFPSFFRQMEKGAFIDGKNYHLAANYIPTVLYLAVVGCVLLSLTVVCETYGELLLQILLVALGLATRVVMGFTPTIYVSQERTFLYLYMLLGVSAVFLLLKNRTLFQTHARVYEGMRLAGAFLAAACVILNLTEIGG